MTATVRGIVKEGRVVPSAPLPEGSSVEIHLCDTDGKGPATQPRPKISMMEYVISHPSKPSYRCFPTWEEYERFLREEREAGERQ